jgi:hypothetical protein
MKIIKGECFDFANNLCNALRISLQTAIGGVPLAGVCAWLEERVGGVVGYIAELFLEISNEGSVSNYISILNRRVNAIISNSAERGHISKKQLAKDWLNEIKSPSNPWKCFCDQLDACFPKSIGWNHAQAKPRF